MKGKNYWLLGTGITIFLIGSYMFVSWMFGLCIISCTQDFLKFGNFTFERLAQHTYIYYSCPDTGNPFGSPPCFYDLFKGGIWSFYHGSVWGVWLVGLFLVVYSTSKIVAKSRKLSGEQQVR